MKRSHLITAGIASLSLAAAIGVGLVSAASPTASPTSLVDKLVSKFHLSKTEVQAVFDQNKTEHQAARAEHEKDRLDQLVKAGRLTSDQETKIIAKQIELQSLRESFKDKSEAERRAEMKSQKDALQKWANDNNIPVAYLRGIGRKHGHGGRGFDHGEEIDDATQPTSSPTATN